jgi:hypothetical protein
MASMLSKSLQSATCWCKIRACCENHSKLTKSKSETLSYIQLLLYYLDPLTLLELPVPPSCYLLVLYGGLASVRVTCTEVKMHQFQCRIKNDLVFSIWCSCWRSTRRVILELTSKTNISCCTCNTKMP